MIGVIETSKRNVITWRNSMDIIYTENMIIIFMSVCEPYRVCVEFGKFSPLNEFLFDGFLIL